MALFLQVAMVLLSVQAADISFTIDPAVVEFTTFRGEEVVYIPGGASPFADGEPGLPGMGYSMVIPQGTYLENVEVEVLSKIDLPGIHNIAPVLSVPLNQPIPAVIPHSSSYSRGMFPTTAIHDINTGNKTGFRVASFSYVPFIWDPSTLTLSLVTSARLTPVTAPATDAPQLSLSDNQVRTAISALESVVQNPEMLEVYAPEVIGGVDGAPWVLIADECHLETLQPLLDLRATTHGSAFKSTQWIYNNYEGRDTQEQIRDYLIDAYENQGLVYALIVGDGAPYGSGETTRISGLKIGSQLMNSVADLYFSDLDGDWDGDNDNIFGELNDQIDYYSDIYVGRYSTDVTSRLEVMVNRTVAYETNAPAGDWQTTALLAGAGLWPELANPYWGSFICDSIALRIPSSWTVHKLYENSSGHPNNQIDLYNDGVSYTSPNGHGFQSGINWYEYAPKCLIGAANYTDLTNNDMPTVFHSIACLAGSIKNVASIAERLMFSPSGGAVAVMFNSNNGWGSPPNLGASEWLELYFAEVLFVDEQYEIGVAHGISKDEFKTNVSISMQKWVLQENNLLGDPALRFIAGQMGIEEEGNTSVIAPLISAPSPNPASGTCAVNFTMPVTGTATVAVYDISGRIAATVHEGLLSEGQGSLNFDVSSLPSGCYSLVINSETGSASTQMLVLR
ncbi:MAG: T9SS type A sorting domain-containing protein [Candidatus Sabulitectum sp.]|nr:T9SS type A sorting domain-containing protein [Candidatus Sabulitectum sp.]